MRRNKKASFFRPLLWVSECAKEGHFFIWRLFLLPFAFVAFSSNLTRFPQKSTCQLFISIENDRKYSINYREILLKTRKRKENEEIVYWKNARPSRILRLTEGGERKTLLLSRLKLSVIYNTQFSFRMIIGKNDQKSVEVIVRSVHDKYTTKQVSQILKKN